VFSLVVIVYRDGYIVLAFVDFACMFHCSILLHSFFYNFSLLILVYLFPLLNISELCFLYCVLW